MLRKTSTANGNISAPMLNQMKQDHFNNPIIKFIQPAESTGSQLKHTDSIKKSKPKKTGEFTETLKKSSFEAKFG